MVTWGWREKTLSLAQAKTLTILRLAHRRGENPWHKAAGDPLDSAQSRRHCHSITCMGGSLSEGMLNHRIDASHGATPWRASPGTHPSPS